MKRDGASYSGRHDRRHDEALHPPGGRSHAGEPGSLERDLAATRSQQGERNADPTDHRHRPQHPDPRGRGGAARGLVALGRRRLLRARRDVARRQSARAEPLPAARSRGKPQLPADGKRRGVGEHPHRGFETVTFAYGGEVAHRDSSGGGASSAPATCMWMTAASGVVHEEFHSSASRPRAARWRWCSSG